MHDFLTYEAVLKILNVLCIFYDYGSRLNLNSPLLIIDILQQGGQLYLLYDFVEIAFPILIPSIEFAYQLTRICLYL